MLAHKLVVKAILAALEALNFHRVWNDPRDLAIQALALFDNSVCATTCPCDTIKITLVARLVAASSPELKRIDSLVLERLSLFKDLVRLVNVAISQQEDALVKVIIELILRFFQRSEDLITAKIVTKLLYLLIGPKSSRVCELLNFLSVDVFPAFTKADDGEFAVVWKFLQEDG